MIEKHLASWLKDHASLSGVIAGVYPIDAPEARSYPCLVYNQASMENQDEIENGDNELVFETIEVTVLGKTISDVDTVGKILERTPIHGFRGLMDGMFVQAVFVGQIAPEEGHPEPSGDEKDLIHREYQFRLRYQSSDLP